MFTYFLYNSVLLISASSAYIAEHEKHINIRFFARVSVFLALFIPAALRYNTGTDYFSYVSIFEKLNPNSITLEKSWYYLNWFIKALGLSAQWVFVFAAVLIYFPICFFTERKNFFYLILVYILTAFYFKSYNTLRQYIAVSCCISSIFFFKRKYKFIALLFLIFAFLFHSSTVLFVPLIFLSPLKFKSNIFPIAITVCGLLVLFTMNVFVMILNLLALVGSKYARYASSSFFTSKTSLGTGLGVLIRLFPSFLTVFYTTKLVKQNKNNSFSISANIIFIFSYIMAAQFIILGRVRDFFIFIPLLYWGNTFSLKTKYSKIIRIGYFLMLLLLIEVDIQKQTRDTFSNSIYPYISIFEKYK